MQSLETIFHPISRSMIQALTLGTNAQVALVAATSERDNLTALL